MKINSTTAAKLREFVESWEIFPSEKQILLENMEGDHLDWDDLAMISTGVAEIVRDDRAIAPELRALVKEGIKALDLAEAEYF